MSIRNRAMLLMMLFVSLVCGIFLLIIYRQGQQSLEQLIESKVTAADQVAESVLSQVSQQYQRRIDSFVNYAASDTRARMLRAFAQRDRKTLLEISKPFLDILQKENPYFSSLGWILPDNWVFLKVHHPDSTTEQVCGLRPDVAAVNLERVQHFGFTTGQNAPQFRVVHPVFYQGEYLGVLQMGIDARFITDTLQQKLHLAAALAVPVERYAARGGKDYVGLVGETYVIHASDQEIFGRLVNQVNWDAAQQKLWLDEQVYVFHQVLALNDFKGEQFGRLFVAVNVTEMIVATNKGLAMAILLSLLLLLFLAVIFHYSFGSLIEKIFVLNKSLENSNLELEQRVAARTRDLIAETEERKIAEEKLHRAEKMEAIGLMASGVAHDLNNILSGVVNYPELLLLRLPKDSQLRKPLTAIKESGLRAAAVVTDLLTVARDAAKVRTQVHINTLVHEYLQSSEADVVRSRYPEVSIITDLDLNLPELCCSPSHVNKCLMNLVLNAAESFVGAGTITIKSRLLTLPDAAVPVVDLPPGNYIVLQVEDNGSGISEEDLKHIFEPFYTKKQLGRSGTGIGLTVVWNSMQDHGGSVSVQSADQRGTVFSLLFPVGHEVDCLPQGGLPVPKTHGRGETILVVDDEPHQRDIATEILREHGYQVQAVSSGEAAIDYVKEQPVDVLLLDMLMAPGLDGCETYAQIRALYPDQKAVIVSGYAKSHQVEKALDLGARSFLKKPYTMEQLGAAIGAALRQD